MGELVSERHSERVSERVAEWVKGVKSEECMSE